MADTSLVFLRGRDVRCIRDFPNKSCEFL